MLVRDLMTRDVVTVGVDSTLADAVERLLAEEVGSVVVVREGTPVGLVTETDALEAALETDEPLSAIPVAPHTHAPVLTTQPDRTVRKVAGHMERAGVKKVPVVEDMEIVGIVTLTDVVRRLSDIRKEASELSATREEWERRRG